MNSDSLAPEVVSTTPSVDATGVALDVAVIVVFSEAIDPATIGNVTLSLQDASGPRAVSVAYEAASHTAVLTPNAPLPELTELTATVAADVTDVAGNRMAAPFIWSFMTTGVADTTPPSVVSTTPADAGTDVAVNSDVVVTFSEPVQAISVTSAVFFADGGITGAIAVSGSSATFSPAADLPFNTTVTMTVAAGVADLAGNTSSQQTTWSFTTGTAPDNTAPSVVSTTPADATTGVGVNDPVVVQFSEAMAPASVSLSFAPSVTGSIAVNGDTGTWTLSAALAPNTTYTVTVPVAASDLAGNSMAGDHVWTFTTEAAPDTTPPFVVSTNPNDAEVNVTIGASITAVFSESIDPASVTSAGFSMSPGNGTISASGTTVTLTPGGGLLPNTVYTVTLTTAITDAAGVAMAADYVWSFTSEDVPIAVMTWTAPITNADTTPLNDLAGYVIQFGTTSQLDGGFVGYDTVTDIGMPTCVPAGPDTECTHTVTGTFLPGTTYYFAVTAYDTANNVSDFSNEGTKSF